MRRLVLAAALVALAGCDAAIPAAEGVVLVGIVEPADAPVLLLELDGPTGCAMLDVASELVVETGLTTLFAEVRGLAGADHTCTIPQPASAWVPLPLAPVRSIVVRHAGEPNVYRLDADGVLVPESTPTTRLR